MANSTSTWAIWSGRRLARRLTAVAATLVLGACSTTSAGTDVTSLWQMTQRLFNNDTGVQLETAASSPYASIGVRVGDSPEQMLLLASSSADTLLWTASSHIAISTVNGRIVRTVGLDHDLAGYQPTPDGRTSEIRWTADFPDISLYAVPIQCQIEARGPETITILGAAIHTNKTEEHCRSTSKMLDWTYTNSFWTDPANGRVWKSVQGVHPRLPLVTIQTLRPAK